MGLGFFTTRRMVTEYRDKFYIPASKHYRHLMADSGSSAVALNAQRIRLDSAWHHVRVHSPQPDRDLRALHSGDSFSLVTSVFLGQLSPDEVSVELCTGPADAGNQIKSPAFHPMALRKSTPDGWHEYVITVPCPSSGRFGLSARVLPAGGEWKAASPGYVTWSE